jgi:Cu2+-exporting ATPase
MPALAKSDVSFAFGHAVPFAQAKADVVVLSNQLSSVADTLCLAKKTMRVVRVNFVWAGVYNLVCIPLAVLGWLPPLASGVGMALSSVLVVLNSLQLARPGAMKSWIHGRN